MTVETRPATDTARSNGESDSVQQVLDDIVSFLDGATDRFSGLLDRCVDVAARERDLIEREASLAKQQAEFNEQRDRWETQRQQEIAQLQQQIEELTEAWLRLENEQRGMSATNEGGSSRGDRPGIAGSQATQLNDQSENQPKTLATAETGSASNGSSCSPLLPHRHNEQVSASSQGNPPATPGHGNVAAIPKAVQQTPAQVASGALYSASDPPTISGQKQSQTGVGAPEGGGPATVSRNDREIAPDRPDAPGDQVPTREAALEQFSQLQREFGFGSRPSR